MRKSIIIGIILLALFSSGCAEQSSTESKSTVSCESKARELIPEKIELYKSSLWKDWHLVPNQKWKDGTIINEVEKEKKSDSGIAYSKQIKNKDGTILGTRTFSIKPVIKPIEGTEGTYTSDTDKYPMMMFEIVETDFIECNWIE